MKPLVQRIARLWLHGTVLLLLAWFIQFLAGIPPSALTLARSEIHPLLAVAVIFLYFPIAVAWIFSQLLRRESIRRRAATFLSQLSGDAKGTVAVPSGGDTCMAPLLYLGMFSLLNIGLAIALQHLNHASRSLYLATLKNPSALPPLTSFVMAIRWWPWIFVGMSAVTGIRVLTGKLGDRSILHVFASMCLAEGILCVLTFAGYWIPLVSILSKLI